MEVNGYIWMEMFTNYNKMTKAYICNKCGKVVKEVEFGKTIFLLKLFRKGEKSKNKSILAEGYHLCKGCFKIVVGELK